MGLGLKFVALLTYLSFIYIVGSLIFTKGFLLKRVVVEQNSSCHVDFAHFDEHESGGCWLHKRFDKAIIIIIDALRFDFMAPTYSSNDTEIPFLNKLTTIHNFLSRDPKRARLYRFIADPPTTTLQRLKGLTTGSLPTFVDAGSNFAGSEITEDNFIDQALKRGKRLKFLGDDTWISLFPKRFHTEYSFPSLNVKDLHTVDDGILENLYTELGEKDWDMMIAHFLGVDHCGHRFGPNHPAMAEKLSQMNEVIRNVTAMMKPDTVLFVLGDHGMTRTGDHGGDSADELEAGLFVFSPQQITASEYYKAEYKTVSQTDLVPTISLLMGMPVPFSSLGKVITDLFNYCTWTHDSHLKEIYHTVQALRLNAQQISSYLDAYWAQSKDFPQDKLIHLQNMLDDAENALQQLVTIIYVQGQADRADKKLHALKVRYETYIDEVRLMCQNIWAKFDVTSILLGGLTVSIALLLNVYFIKVAYHMSEDKTPGSVAVVVLGTFVYLFYAVIQTLFIQGDEVSFMAFILGLVDLTAVGIVVYDISRSAARQNKTSSKHSSVSVFTIQGVLTAFICLVTMITFGANSFVIYEGSIYLYLAQTMILMLTFKTVQKHFAERFKTSKEHSYRKQHDKFDIMQVAAHPAFVTVLAGLGCCSCLRLSSNFRSCREEQVNCTNSVFLEPLSSLSETGHGSKNIRYFFSVACLGSVVLLSRWWLRHHGNLNGMSPSVVCAKYVLPVAGVLCCLHWAVQGLPQKVLDALPVWQQVALPQAMYILIIASLIIIVLQPLMLHQLSQSRDQISVPGLTGSSTKLIQRVYRHVRLNWQEHFGAGDSEREKPPVVYGLASTYSAAVIFISTVLVTLLSLMLGDGLSPSLLLATVAVFLFCEIFTALAWHGNSLLGISDHMFPGALTVSLMSSTFFYSMSHQPTIPSIHWEAAYVGFHGDFQNQIIPAILIFLNTFSAEIFFTVISPLLILLPYTRGFLVKFLNRLRGEQASEWKGDFTLYERPDEIRGHLFKLFSTMFLLNGLKLFGGLCAAGFLRRHLMVWKIFAPRFIFQALSTFTVFGISVLLFLFILRVDLAVGRWVQQLKDSQENN